MNAMKKLTVALALGLVSSSALALGLGQIRVKSRLNEPLRAEIPVLSASAAELHGLTVGLASSEAFARIGLNLAQFDVPLKFAVVTKRNGHTVIEITTKEAVSNPALDFLVEVDWANGKLLREYTVLLDPPVTAAAAVVAPNQPQSHAESNAATAKPVTGQSTAPHTASAAAPVTMPAPTVSRAAAASAPVPASGSVPAGGGQVVVGNGDTLWQIAKAHAASRSSINQMMLALKRVNPDAFFKDNINALKSGAILRMPTRAAVDQLDHAAALAAVRQQNRRWIKVRAPMMVARAGGNAPRVDSEDGANGSPADAHLALVPPSKAGGDIASRRGVAGGTGDATITGLKHQLANAKSALASEKQHRTELDARVEDLEGINSKNTRLLSLKNAEIAELQRKLAQAQSAPAMAATVASGGPAMAASVTTDIFAANAAAAATTAMAPAGSIAKAGSAAVITPLATPASSPASGATVSVAQTASAATVAAASVNPAAASTAAPASPTELGAQPPWYMQDWLKWLIGLIILALIALGLSRARRKPAARLLDTDDVDADDADVDYADDGEIDADADEDALMDELEQRPDDLAVHMELASLYYAQRDQDKFEAAAQEMVDHVDDPNCEEWQQVRAMGEELCPDSPLFAASLAEGHDEALEHDQAAEPSALLDDDLDLAADDDLAPEQGAQRRKDDGYSYDFNLTPEAGAVAPVIDDHFGISDDSLADESAEAPDEQADDDSGFGIDSKPAGDASTVEESADAAILSGDDYDDSTGDHGFSSDPVDTKLDLARAYQDMGDAEGARAMLDEVLTEGSEAQKDIARKLLDELT